MLLEVVILKIDDLYNHVMEWCWNPLMLNCPFRSDSTCIYTKPFCDDNKDSQGELTKIQNSASKNPCGLNEEKCPIDLKCINDTQFCNLIRDCNATSMATEHISMASKAFN